MEVIKVENLGIRFILPQDRPSTLKEAFLSFMRRQKNKRVLWALKEVSFAVEKGETIGIIGENGSGKSTLLRILAGIYQPDEGRAEVKGRTSALIELGAGFHEELTGRENIYLNGSLLGMKKKRINSIIEDIISFSELREHIDIPIKKYSSGMLLRLGFSIAAFVEPEIILIDEVLAVGDYYFQEKCFAKIFEFKQEGKSLIFVSHDMNAVRRICDRVFILQKGKLLKKGDVEENISTYLKMAGPREGRAFLKNNELELIFNHGKLFLFWEGKEITNNLGGHNALKWGSSWLSSVNAHWSIIESSNDAITAEGKFDSPPILLKWNLKIISEDKFSWAIDIIPQIDLSISENHTDLLLSSQYKKWFSSDGKGKFLHIEKDDNWRLIHDNHDKDKKYIGVESQAEDDLPGVKMDFINPEINDIPRILNSDFKINSRSLHSLLIAASPISGFFKDEKIRIFSTEISIA